MTNKVPPTESACRDAGVRYEHPAYVTARRICTFRHNREDGMAICLEKASKAVQKSRDQQRYDLLRCLQEDIF